VYVCEERKGNAARCNVHYTAYDSRGANGVVDAHVGGRSALLVLSLIVQADVSLEHCAREEAELDLM
jgi:hypothetical protein